MKKTILLFVVLIISGVLSHGSAQVQPASDFIGNQIWLEQEDTKERVEHLFKVAAESGHGWARLFLMWPWIEEKPGEYDFHVFDWAFEAAAKNGIKIKATLTANSGPWHIGTPSTLHSYSGFISPEQREPMEKYIRECVERYHDHPGLGQWLLWNEPTDYPMLTEERLAFWREWVKEYYGGDLERLNHEWYTGYESFDEIPFAENVPGEHHRQFVWNKYAPWFAEWQYRKAWLVDELTWIKDILREIDPKTPISINPSNVFENHAAYGYGIDGLVELADVIGASFHPAWQFRFAQRSQFPALMSLGVKYLGSFDPGTLVEITEVQTGNTVNSSFRPNDVYPDELARFYLAGIASGASSVTGWAFNHRRNDFETGDWGLVDNLDQPSVRTESIKRVHDVLNKAFEKTGSWSASKPKALILTDPRSNALEHIEQKIGHIGQVPGRTANDGMQGQGLLGTVLLQCGISTTLAYSDDFESKVDPKGLVIAAHLLAWDEPLGQRLLEYAKKGGTILLDAPSGRREYSSEMHYPWPGGMTGELGMRAVGLETNSEGWDLELNGAGAGNLVLSRFNGEFSDEKSWRSWDEPRYVWDNQPLVWERSYGKGRIIFVRGYLAASLLYDNDLIPMVYELIKKAGGSLSGEVTSVSAKNFIYTIPVKVEKGSLTLVMADGQLNREGRSVYLKAARGTYYDFWSEKEYTTGPDGELVLDAPDGIALLWKQ
ncbi:MAG: beta-galactosidase [Bacteroidota bacterium]